MVQVHVFPVAQNELFDIWLEHIVVRLPAHALPREARAMRKLGCGYNLLELCGSTHRRHRLRVCFCFEMSVELLLLPQLRLMRVPAD